MLIFVCNFQHCNFQIKHCDQQKGISDCPLNQNQNAWTSIIFLPWSISVLGPEFCSKWGFEMFMSFLWVSQSFYFFLLETVYVTEVWRSTERSFCRATYRGSFHQKLKVAPQPVRLFCTCVLYDKLKMTLQHRVNATGFILPHSLCPLYTLWRVTLTWYETVWAGVQAVSLGMKNEGIRKKRRPRKRVTLWKSRRSIVIKSRVVKPILRENTELSRKWKRL